MHAFPTAPPGIFMLDGNKPSPHGYGINEGDSLEDNLCLYSPFWENAGSRSQSVVGDGTADGTNIGTTWVTKPRGPVLDFGGLGDAFRVDIPFSDALDMGGATEATWSVWSTVRSLDGARDSRFLDHHGATTGNSWGWAYGPEGGGTLGMGLFINATSGNWNMLSDNSIVTLDECHLYTVTWRGGDHCRFYLDGKFFSNGDKVAAGPIATVAGTADERKIYIGDRDPADATRALDGQIESVAIWNRALETSEIKKLFSEPFGLITPGTQTISVEVAAAGGRKNPLNMPLTFPIGGPL
ncbi:hypothetical protein LCGC14_0356820 [marine sediment metagenome]|uniref:LamG-like jellyroll fold domain-containing protein n=1 Tax=marine sediment metagenome TaxID=412755 RepID=A0A0F9WH28_9ZZZZ